MPRRFSRLAADDLSRTLRGLAFEGIVAYKAADPSLRGSLDALAGTMDAVLEATRATMTADLPPERIGALAEHAAAWLRPLVARAGAVINGEPSGKLPDAPQAIVDELMKR